MRLFAGLTTEEGGVKRLKQNIKSLKRIKADILKYIKELDKLTARYE